MTIDYDDLCKRLQSVDPGWPLHVYIDLANQAAAAIAALRHQLITAVNAVRPAIARAEKAEADNTAIRALMDTYNLGGWTDAIGPMKRALAAERENVTLLEQVAVLDGEVARLGKAEADNAELCKGEKA